MMKRLAVLVVIATMLTGCNQILGVEDITVEDAAPDTAPSLLRLDVPLERQFVRVGGSIEVRFSIEREGMDETAEVSLKAPPVGITAAKVVVEKGKAFGALVVQAGCDATPHDLLLEVSAVSGQSVTDARLRLEVIGAAGGSDNGFADNGYLLANLIPGADVIPTAAIGGDDGFVLVVRDRSSLPDVPSKNFIIVKYGIDGHEDLRFGDRGRLHVSLGSLGISNLNGASVAADPQGRYVIAGQGSIPANPNGLDLFLLRVLPDGRLDPSMQPRFLNSEPEDQRVKTVMVVSDGSIVVVGDTGVGSRREPKMWIVEDEGATVRPQTLPPADLMGSNCVFSPGLPQDEGILLVDAHSVVRMRLTGTPDPSFGVGGHRALIGIGGGALPCLLRNGGANRVLVGGASGLFENSVAVWRIERNGAMDGKFGRDGAQLIPMDLRAGIEKILEVWESPDGSVYGAVATQDDRNLEWHSRVFRLASDGALDTSFGNGGAVTDAFEFSADLAVFYSRHRVVFVSQDADGTAMRQLWY